MMNERDKILLLEHIISNLEIPESYYERAKKRYEDLGEWVGREDSTLREHEPHVFVQGSFRLGTAIRPLSESEEYDLDLCCKLTTGITTHTHTQEELKNLVGHELRKYRAARKIQKELESKHRCWRLEYQDDLSFHMDIVPCIPSEETRKSGLFSEMRTSGIDERMARQISDTTILITDDRNSNFDSLTDDWEVSNPEGYAEWFEMRMAVQAPAIFAEHAKVDPVPLYRRKTPLQRAIQLLKRHRDSMFEDRPESKPISIIITTLAARAYNGELSIASALSSILSGMGKYVNGSIPRIPNPVNPDEDFADRWSMPQSASLQLEENFCRWLEQAQQDFNQILDPMSVQRLTEDIEERLSMKLREADLSCIIGPSIPRSSSERPPHQIIEDAPKPWNE